MSQSENEENLPKVSFDLSRATDLSYYPQFASYRIDEYNKTKPEGEASLRLRKFEHEHLGLLFGLVDMMFCFGCYTSRKSALDTWSCIKRSEGGAERKTTQFWVTSKQMDYCSIQDFIDHVLDRIGGSIAADIRKVLRKENALVLRQSLGLVAGEATASDHSQSLIFDATKALDLAYCLQYADAKVAAAGEKRLRVSKVTHTDGTVLYSVTDLLFAMGNYANRKSAYDSWFALKRALPNSFTTLQAGTPIFWKRVSSSGDHCTLEDFLDRVLPHTTGEPAETIKMHRSRAATLLSTGSSLLATINHNSLEIAQKKADDERQTLADIRRHTETLFVESGISREIDMTRDELPRCHNVEVVYVNLPPGPMVYRRVSFGCSIADYVCASDEKLQFNINKMGVMGDPVQRHKGYGFDGGFFDVILTAASYPEAQTMEASVNALTRPARTTFGREYYNADSYSQIYELEGRGDEWKHMLPFIKRQLEQIYVATTKVATTDTERKALLSQYRQKASVRIPLPDIWRKVSLFVEYRLVRLEDANVEPFRLNNEASPPGRRRECDRAYNLFESGKISFTELKELLQLAV